METGNLLSIVIPVYRVEKYLNRCVDALIAQIQPEVELILVDDGSDDACPRICDEYSEQYAYIKTVHKTNGGLSSAVAEGINHATGIYIGFCDSDDWVSPSYVSDILKVIGEQSPDVIYFDYTGVFESTKNHLLMKSSLLKPGRYEKEACAELKKIYLQRNGISPNRWTKVIKRTLIEQTLPYYDSRARIGEDILFMAPILCEMTSFYYLDQALINYNINDGSMMRNFDKRYIVDYNLIFDVLSEVPGFDKSFLGWIHYTNMKTMVKEIACSGMKKKGRYVKELYREYRIKKQLAFVDRKSLPLKERLLLGLLKNFSGWPLMILYSSRSLLNHHRKEA